MKFSLFACGLAAILIASLSQAHAQAPAPAPGGYAGPSAVPLTTVRELLAHARDDQPARLQGRIVARELGKHYRFDDGTGVLPVEIADKRFPAGAAIGADQRVEIAGKVDKGLRKTGLEVEELRALP